MLKVPIGSRYVEQLKTKIIYDCLRYTSVPKTFLWVVWVFFFANCATLSSSTKSQDQTPITPETYAYMQGLGMLASSDYMAAGRHFHKMVEAYPRSQWVSGYAFLEAESYFRGGMFDLAQVALRHYLARFAEGKRREEAEMKLKMCVEEVGEVTEADLKEMQSQNQKENSSAPDENREAKEEALSSDPEEKVTIESDTKASHDPIVTLSMNPNEKESEPPPLEAQTQASLTPRAVYLPWTSPFAPRSNPSPDDRDDTDDGDDVLSQVLTLEMESFGLPDLSHAFLAIRKAGIDTVVFKVFRSAKDASSVDGDVGVLFQTDVAPFLTDWLWEATELAHRAGLKVWAWMTLKYADFGLEMHSTYLIHRYNLATGEVELGQGLNLFQEDVANHLVELFRSLAVYPIDGILLSDVFLSHNEGCDPESWQKFMKDHGMPAQPRHLFERFERRGLNKYRIQDFSDLFWRWSAWKRKRSMELVTQIKEAVYAIHPNLEIIVPLEDESLALLTYRGKSFGSEELTDFERFGSFAFPVNPAFFEGQLGLTPHDGYDLMKTLMTTYEQSLKNILMLLPFPLSPEVNPDERHKIFSAIQAFHEKQPIMIVPLLPGVDLSKMTDISSEYFKETAIKKPNQQPQDSHPKN